MSETLPFVPDPKMKDEIDFEVCYNNNNTTFDLPTGKRKIDSVL